MWKYYKSPSSFHFKPNKDGDVSEFKQSLVDQGIIDDITDDIKQFEIRNMCPLTGKNDISSRGKFWKHMLYMGLDPDNIDYEECMNYSGEVIIENTSKLMGLDMFPYIWQNYFKEKMNKKPLQDIIGFIHIDLLIRLVKIYRKEIKAEDLMDDNKVEEEKVEEEEEEVNEGYKESNIKKEFGQFYTKNYDYILQTIRIPDNIKNIIEPFAGDGDLIEYIKNYNDYNIESYDIDPKKEYIIQRDTLMNPPVYNGKFVITNPPYLARNKSKNKEIYDKYDVNDLYKCFIKNLINDRSLGGIIIIPLNFICSTRKNDVLLREQFLSIYSIQHINIFEEQVFSDTSATVCSILFNLNGEINEINEINIDVFPSNINIKTLLNKENNYTIGGEIYNIEKNEKYKFKRLMTKNIDEKNTNIVVKCIDDNSKSMINAEYIEDDSKLFIDNTPKCSARGYLTLIINPPINKKRQKKLVIDFNNYLNENRNKYHSLFLANYRESNDIARKRISFDLVYRIIGYLIDK
jgi:hypothetical protein